MSPVLSRSLLAAAILSLGSARDAGAFLARDRILLSTDIAINATAGPQRIDCSASDPVAAYSTRTWRLTVGSETPRAEGDGLPSTASARCSSSSGSEPVAALQDASMIASLLLDITTKANLEVQMEDEKVLTLKISWTARILSGLDGDGNPVYQSSIHERELFFSDESEAFLPVVVAEASDNADPGYREVVLRFRVVAQAEESARYGIIAITSDFKGADVLLDGGLAGTVPGSGEAIFRNVPVGLRDVEVRDSAGTSVRRAVRVRPRRTSLVELRRPGLPPDVTALRLVQLGRNDKGFEEFRRPIDGGVVVKIPAGEFLMGNKETERTPHEHRVFVSEFLMDRTGVTWRMFKKFAAATGTSLPLHTPYWGILDDHPANYVTWEEAGAYCGWAGGRLATEAEREKAARGTDARKYPWGDEEPTPERGVFRHTWGHEATGAVGTRPAGASPYGLLDMGGNVWEWCSDWYSNEFYLVSPYMNPKGPTTGRAHVVRGGSWDSRPAVLSASCRSWGHRGYREGDFGFRCAMNSPVP